MPRTSSRKVHTARGAHQGPHDIAAIVRSFVGSLVTAVEQNTTYRIKAALASAPRRSPTAPKRGARRQK